MTRGLYTSSGTISGWLTWYGRTAESAAVAVLQISFIVAIFTFLHVAMVLHALASKDHRPTVRKTHNVTRDAP